MIFIGIALLIAAGLALAVNADAGAVVGLNSQQTGHVVFLVLVLIIVAGGADSPAPARGRRAPSARLSSGPASSHWCSPATPIGAKY